MKEAGELINPYALDYPTCTDTDLFSSTSKDESSISRYLGLSTQVDRLYNLRDTNPIIWNVPPFLPNEDMYHPCAERYMTKYLNREDVKSALHVNTTRTWKTCTDEISYSQSDIMTSQIRHYQELINRAKVNGSNLKILVFSGDDDSGTLSMKTLY